MDVVFGFEIGLERLQNSEITRWSLAVLLGNLGDALSTLTFLQLQMAHEVNPLMSLAYQISPMSFVAAKLALVHLAMLLLYMNRHLRAARVGETLGGLAYVALMGWHAVCWSYA